MKKFLILALVAVVPLMIGCMGGGGDDGPNIGPVTPPATANLSVGVPLTALGASLRALINPADATVIVGGHTLTYATTTANVAVYSKNLSAGEVTALGLGNGATANLTLSVTVNGISFTTTMTASLGGQSSTTAGTIKTTVAFAKNADGTYTMTVQAGTGVSGGNSRTSTPVLVPIALQYLAGTVFQNLNGATDVPANGTILRVVFNATSLAKATDSFAITARSVSGNTYSLTQGDLAGTNPLLTASSGVASAGAYIQMTLNRTVTSTNRRFQAGKSYTLTYLNSSVEGAFGATTGVKVATGAAITATFSTK